MFSRSESRHGVKSTWSEHHSASEVERQRRCPSQLFSVTEYVWRHGRQRFQLRVSESNRRAQTKQGAALRRQAIQQRYDLLEVSMVDLGQSRNRHFWLARQRQ